MPIRATDEEQALGLELLKLELKHIQSLNN